MLPEAVFQKIGSGNIAEPVFRTVDFRQSCRKCRKIGSDNFIKMFIGYDMADLSFSDKEAIMETQQYQKMPAYPKDGCVRKFDDIWVVKMCE